MGQAPAPGHLGLARGAGSRWLVSRHTEDRLQQQGTGPLTTQMQPCRHVTLDVQKSDAAETTPEAAGRFERDYQSDP